MGDDDLDTDVDEQTESEGGADGADGAAVDTGEPVWIESMQQWMVWDDGRQEWLAIETQTEEAPPPPESRQLLDDMEARFAQLRQSQQGNDPTVEDTINRLDAMIAEIERDLVKYQQPQQANLPPPPEPPMDDLASLLDELERELTPPPPPWPVEQQGQQDPQPQQAQQGNRAEDEQDEDQDQQGQGQQPADVPLRARLNVLCGSATARTPTMPVADLMALYQACGGTDLTAAFAEVRAARMKGEGSAFHELFSWGGSKIGITGSDTDEITQWIGMLGGQFLTEDMQAENDDRLHRLKNDGDSCRFAQAGSVVLLGPGDGDPRYALLRFASSILTGNPAASTEGTITRRYRRMRRDGLDVKTISSGDRAEFKAAMKPITDKPIEWV